MRCPFCHSDNTQVKDSRPCEDSLAIRRRRVCEQCDARFTTFERAQLKELKIIKSNGDVKTYDREKLLASLRLALRKRPVEDEVIQLLVNRITRELESSGETQILSKKIGELAMNGLAELDKVAYVRFASVYWNFHEMQDFSDFIRDAGAPDSIKSKFDDI